MSFEENAVGKYHDDCLAFTVLTVGMGKFHAYMYMYTCTVSGSSHKAKYIVAVQSRSIWSMVIRHVEFVAYQKAERRMKAANDREQNTEKEKT